MKNYNDCGCGKGGNDWTFGKDYHDDNRDYNQGYCEHDRDFYGEHEHGYDIGYDYSPKKEHGYDESYSCEHGSKEYDYDFGGKKEREHSCSCEHGKKEHDCWHNHEHKECDNKDYGSYSFQKKEHSNYGYGRKDEHCAKVYTLSKHENKRDCHDDKDYGYDMNGKKERNCDCHEKERDCDWNENKREREFTCLCHCKICIPPFPFRCNK